MLVTKMMIISNITKKLVLYALLIGGLFGSQISKAEGVTVDTTKAVTTGAKSDTTVAEMIGVETKKEKKEGFDPAEMIMHHIGDSHEWHMAGNVSLPLPVILYSSDLGLNTFMSSAFKADEDNGTTEINGYELEHGKIIRKDGKSFVDLSITKVVAGMLSSVFFILLIFLVIAKSFRKNHGKAPKGIQSFVEPLIIFVRDEIAIPSIGETKYKKFLPYLLTLFFFIWINNLLGLIPFFPGGINVTGNIAITMTLALLTFVLTNISGNKHYWSHILWPAGVPVTLKLPIAAIEFMGIFTKPFALMIRLFANILAGHIIILSIISLIFLLGPVLSGLGAGGVSAIAVVFSVFMNCLELLVAALQAYIFTMLTALFIGQAVDEPAHH
jgi:F-type H+-transporting ATPase subunit a